MAKKAKTLTINDGTLVITLEEAEEGGFLVTSPMDPALITQGETIEDCLMMAHDAWNLLREYRRDRDHKRPRKATA